MITCNIKDDKILYFISLYVKLILVFIRTDFALAKARSTTGPAAGSAQPESTGPTASARVSPSSAASSLTPEGK